MNNYGWDFCTEPVSDNYISKCALFGSDDNAFNSFRQDNDYCIVLEGKDFVIGTQSLERILRTHPESIDLVKSNLSKFRENDIYGSPTIHEYDIFGKMSPGTSVYVSNALDILNFAGNRIKKIVEIGGGYGGMCKILSSLVEFDEYILIDLPEVISLCKKYLNHFPDIRNKITYISCEDLKSIDKIEDVDLFMGISSFAEMNQETQSVYVNKILKYSKLGYLVYNTLHMKQGVDNYNRFLLDVEGIFEKKIEMSSYNIAFIYLKRKV